MLVDWDFILSIDILKIYQIIFFSDVRLFKSINYNNSIELRFLRSFYTIKKTILNGLRFHLMQIF